MTGKTSRRSFLRGSAATAVAANLLRGQQTPFASSPPNILLILADDLGYGDLSSYEAADLRTPLIDGLVDSGMRFDRFYANSPVCSPTRAALLSGKYPDRVGVPGVIRTHAANNWGNLSPGAALLPRPLKSAGYHSGLVGKWHLGLEPPQHTQRPGLRPLSRFPRRHDGRLLRPSSSRRELHAP